jgi:site-specific DNA recombinase
MKNDLKTEFAKYAKDGYIGDPTGPNAYAYLRASSEKQVEEGSSFSRQMESIHKAARRDHVRVAFDLIFFDDGFTGFEFEHRPALLRLRHEVKVKPQAQHLIIEDIDRLSRNADWQQGFLLEEFASVHIQVHFYIHPGSQLERYVRGYVAQEGMKKDLERMRMGQIHKALDGKVTARKRKYGYIKTHPQNTYYVLHPEESKVMRWVYEKLIYSGWTLKMITDDLNARGVPTYFRAGFWNKATLYQLVRSPVYKGVFYSHKNNLVKTGKFDQEGRPTRTNIVRPEAEWIQTTVPQIVTEEEWQLAQEAMARNAKRSSKNYNKREWLLSGLLKCTVCIDYMMTGQLGGSKKFRHRYYRCNSNGSYKALNTGQACGSLSIRAEDLERRVWEEIEKVIYDPDIIIKRLEERESEERRMGYEEQITFIDKQVSDLTKERAKYEAAYQRDIYTLDEFEEKMKDVRAQLQALEISRAKLQAKVNETNSIEQQKRVVLVGLERIRKEIETARHEGKTPHEIPFTLKRRILTHIVETVYVDTNKREFTIEGEIKGTFAVDVASSEPNADPESSDEQNPRRSRPHKQGEQKTGREAARTVKGQTGDGVGLVSSPILR